MHNGVEMCPNLVVECLSAEPYCAEQVADLALQQLDTDYNNTLQPHNERDTTQYTELSDQTERSSAVCVEHSIDTVAGDASVASIALSVSERADVQYSTEQRVVPPLSAERIDEIKSIMSTIQLAPPPHLSSLSAEQYVDRLLRIHTSDAVRPQSSGADRGTVVAAETRDGKQYQQLHSDSADTSCQPQQWVQFT